MHIVSNFRPVNTIQKEQIQVPDFTTQAYNLNISEREFCDFIKVLNECDITNIADKPKNINFALSIAGKRIIETPFSYSSSHKEDEPDRWKKLRETLTQLYLRVLKEGKKAKSGR